MFYEIIIVIMLQFVFINISDNMPVTWCYDLEDGQQYCSTGFPMGCYKPANHDNNLCATILRVRLIIN